MKDNFIIKQNTRQNINTTQTDRQNNLSDLPNDMICMISSYLDEKSFYQMKTVFPKDITNDIMWKDCELSDTIKIAIYNNCRSLFMYAVERGYLLECADIDLATDLKRIWLIKKIININPELAQSAYDWSIYNVNIDVYKEAQKIHDNLMKDINDIHKYPSPYAIFSYENISIYSNYSMLPSQSKTGHKMQFYRPDNIENNKKLASIYMSYISCNLSDTCTIHKWITDIMYRFNFTTHTEPDTCRYILTPLMKLYLNNFNYDFKFDRGHVERLFKINAWSSIATLFRHKIKYKHYVLSTLMDTPSPNVLRYMTNIHMLMKYLTYREKQYLTDIIRLYHDALWKTKTESTYTLNVIHAINKHELWKFIPRDYLDYALSSSKTEYLTYLSVKGLNLYVKDISKFARSMNYNSLKYAYKNAVTQSTTEIILIIILICVIGIVIELMSEKNKTPPENIRNNLSNYYIP